MKSRLVERSLTRRTSGGTLSDMQRIRDALRRLVQPALALLTAFLLGAVLIVLTDFDHLQQLGTDPLAAIGGALGGLIKGYAALFSGAIGDPGSIVAAIRSGNAEDIARALRPDLRNAGQRNAVHLRRPGPRGVVPRRPVQPRASTGSSSSAAWAP